ncbi:thymidylatekinase [Artaxa digramma nucleopolyhedrovirus]|uniref:Thymidylatekinase n=1 Tax=Artaxa digramma nucleopolyhedrovirus TaxID=3070910 RepID=A0AAE6R703_9ABAC|nr:thymidylatekinase [Euproctis digramma nucleopolyhedrovirus]QHB21764.1 thymidylatekinase [Artaxa digramma nucleopolyhedrovirus]
MSHLVSLGGVACTTKTTILEKLKKVKGIVVHQEDYKELNDKYNFDPRTGSMMFSAYRCLNDEKYKRDFGKVHVFDRHPMEALVYATLHQDMDDADTLRQFELCQSMGLCKGWQMFVLSPSPKCVPRVTEMMKARDNKLDTYSDEYVYNQMKRFDQWQSVVGGKKITVDCLSDLNDQQNKIIKKIQSEINKWSFHRFCNNGLDSYKMYAHRLPVLNDKIAMFNINDTIVKYYDCSNGDLQLKHSNVKIKFIELLSENYTIVLLCDMDGSYRETKMLIENLCKLIDLPLMVLMFDVAHPNDYNNKVLKLFEFLTNQQPLINQQNCFSCSESKNKYLFFVKHVDESMFFTNNISD